MLFSHGCRHPLWMEIHHVGGQSDAPWYYSQLPIQMGSVAFCPGCDAALPTTISEHTTAISEKQLVATGETE